MTTKTFLPSSQVLEISRRLNLVKEFRDSGLSLREFSNTKKISTAQLCRWNKRVGGDLDAYPLRDGRERAGSKAKIDQRALAWALCMVTKHPQAPMTVIHRELSKECQRQGWQVPGYKKLSRHIQKMPNDFKTFLQGGMKGLFEKSGLVARHESDFPGQCFHIDFSEVKNWVRGEGGLYKPYLTIVMDAYSRCVVGWRVHRSVPDALESLHALGHAVFPKSDERSPFYGVPYKLRSDNGSVYASTDVQDFLLRLNIIWDPTPKACPSANGKLERIFLTFNNGLFSFLDGYASRVNALKIAEKVALPSTVFEKKLEEFIHIYHHTVHSSIHCTPYERWTNQIEKAYGLNTPPELIREALKVRKEVRIERDGVEMYGCHWNHPDLVTLVGETVIVRVPLEGVPSSIDCYTKNGTLIADLKPVEHDNNLANAINQNRLARSIELQSLKKAIRETGEMIARENNINLPTSNTSLERQNYEGYETPQLPSIRPAPRLEIEE